MSSQLRKRVCAIAVFLTVACCSAVMAWQVGDPVPGEPGAFRRPFIPYKRVYRPTQRQAPLLNVKVSQIDVEAFPTVSAYAQVTDENGQQVPGLTLGSFTLTEQSEAESAPTTEQIASVEEMAGQAQLSVAIVIDTSGSMLGSALTGAKTAAKLFVDSMGASDQACLVDFASAATVRQTLTTDKTVLKAAIDRLAVSGYTAMYDGAYLGIEQLAAVSGVKALIVLADGDDNNSWHTNTHVIDYAKSLGVPIYSIGLGSSLNPTRLQDLSDNTGGYYKNAPTAADLQQLYLSISTSIRNQYKITYTTHNTVQDERDRTVTVTASTATASGSGTGVYRSPFVKLWVDIVGRDQIRAGRNQTYFVRLGNSGNVQASYPSTLIALPASARAELSMPDVQEVLVYDPSTEGSLPLTGYVVLEASAASLGPGEVRSVRCDIRVEPGSANFELRASPAACVFNMMASAQDNLKHSSHVAVSVIPSYARYSLGASDITIVVLDVKVYDLNEKNASTVHPFICFDGNVYTQVNGKWVVKPAAWLDAQISHVQDIVSQAPSFVKNGPDYLEFSNGLMDRKSRFHPPVVISPADDAGFRKAVRDAVGTGLVSANSCILFPEKHFFESFGVGSPAGLIPNGDESNNPRSGATPRALLESLGIPLTSSAAFAGANKSWLRIFQQLSDLENGQIESAKLPVMVVQSIDPNDIAGPAGYGDPRYVPLDQTFQYTIYFENLAAATAEAEDIVVTTTVDSDLDYSWFQFGDSSHPSTLTTNFNSSTGKATWTFSGINLPPNVNPPEGEGWVTFTIKPKTNLTTGTEIRNKASIKFDYNAPIDTPEWVNTIDNTAPISTMGTPITMGYRVAGDSISWSGDDDENGSGVKDYTIYVSDNGATYTPWLTNTADTSAVFTGQYGHAYDFYCRSRDNVGNIEQPPLAPQYTTQVGTRPANWTGLAMVSVPLIPDDPDPKQIAAFDTSLWASYFPNLGKYVLYSNDPGQLTWFIPADNTPGRGFWARFTDQVTVPQGTIPAQDQPMTIHLLRGWNLVGNPFLSAVKWDVNAIQVQEPGAAATSLKIARKVVANYAWGWKQNPSDPYRGSYYLVYDSAIKPGSNDTLEPWQGYWIKAYKECDLIIPAP